MAAANHRLDESVRELAAARSSLEAGEAKATGILRDLEGSRRRLSDVTFPAALGGRARFLIEVPVTDSKLYVDDKLQEDGDKLIREFITAPLQPDKRYALELRIEVPQKDGKVATATRRVVFKANSEQRLYLTHPNDEK